jgi:hypothetical protein
MNGKCCHKIRWREALLVFVLTGIFQYDCLTKKESDIYFLSSNRSSEEMNMPWVCYV